MVLAHRERFEHRKTQREMAADRFKPGAHPGTLPNPGVYARHNAVDVPARLPDGRGSALSVSTVLHKQPVRVPTNGQNGGADES
jgi:NADH-quinone oxidoreductase subunit J